MKQLTTSEWQLRCDQIHALDGTPNGKKFEEEDAEYFARYGCARAGCSNPKHQLRAIAAMMTEEERGNYILNWVRPGITTEQQIREVLPLVAGELGNNYSCESHIRASRYVHDVRWLLAEIDRLRGLASKISRDT